MEEKIPFLDINFRIRRLEETDYARLSNFICGEKELDDFFHYEMRDCVRYKYLAAYCAYINHDEIIGIFTLMNDALMISGQTEKEDFIEDLKFEAKENIVDFLSNQVSYPAINLGHLGVLKEFQGKGIGTAIIDLVVETFATYTQAGCQFVTVDAINTPATIQFYRDNLFSFQTNRDLISSIRRMYRIL